MRQLRDSYGKFTMPQFNKTKFVPDSSYAKALLSKVMYVALLTNRLWEPVGQDTNPETLKVLNCS